MQNNLGVCMAAIADSFRSPGWSLARSFAAKAQAKIPFPFLDRRRFLF
jgi:hypothetical protein